MNYYQFSVFIGIIQNRTQNIIMSLGFVESNFILIEDIN